MKIYNSLTRKVEEFTPLNDGQVSLYTCGPTVYDHVHIGNLRTYVLEDTLSRALRANGYDLNHVMNITDVDDKTIARSHQQYPDDEPTAALAKLAGHYENIFLEDAAKVGIDFAGTKVVRATEHIQQMQALIRQIPNKYVGEDGVYYDITKDDGYGVLVKLDKSHAHHRINNDEYDKDHVADFALWKKQVGDEPAWEFELDGQNLKGRPGWHIECSAMSVKYLGQPFDIHTGGVDLKFPHHENEIAQSRAAAGKPLANYFVHGEHLLVDGHKMSKKLNNFYTLADVEDKGFDPLALRLLFLQAHYRSQLNFTWESLEAAAANLKTLSAWADLTHQREGLGSADAKTVKRQLGEVINDDLNTSQALAIINNLAGKNLTPSSEILEYIDALLGLNLASRPDISDSQKQIIAQRETARQASDWAKSDELRDELAAQGIQIKDESHGPVWSQI